MVNGLNQYTSVRGVAVSHDANGNLIADHQGRSFAYDAENVLRSASGYSGVGEIIYRYDGAGNRMSKSVSGAVSSYYYSGDQEILETDGSGATVRRYVRLPGSVDEPLAMIDYTLASGCGGALPAACVRYAHQDRLGSVVAVSDGSDGELEALFSYSPYGMSGTEGDAGFPFRFTGQKVEAETGLYYYKARYYDPEIGRFLQTDPIGYEDQQNWYAYTFSDPVNLVDPDGRKVEFANSSTGRFKKQFGQAINYLKSNKIDGAFARLQESGDTITVEQGLETSFDPETDTITWNPEAGLEVEGGGVQMPALGLLHEGGHAEAHLNNPEQEEQDFNTPNVDFDNEAERKVIQGLETPSAMKAGEPTRNTHEGKPVRVRCPTCNE